MNWKQASCIFSEVLNNARKVLIALSTRMLFSIKTAGICDYSIGINIRKQNAVYVRWYLFPENMDLVSDILQPQLVALGGRMFPNEKCLFSCTNLICRIQTLTSFHLNLAAISCVNI